VRAYLVTALTASQQYYGCPGPVWTVTDMLGRQEWPVYLTTFARTLHALGDVYRRPKHDLIHWEDAEAVASANYALTELREMRAAAEAGIRLL
jgi:hypothetical protein